MVLLSGQAASRIRHARDHTAVSSIVGKLCGTVRLHFGRTLLVVGDVMGHGLEAAVE